MEDKLDFLVERVKVLETQMAENQTKLQYLVDKTKYDIDKRTEADHMNGTLIACKVCGNEMIGFHFKWTTQFCTGCGMHRYLSETELVEITDD